MQKFRYQALTILFMSLFSYDNKSMVRRFFTSKAAPSIAPTAHASTALIPTTTAYLAITGPGQAAEQQSQQAFWQFDPEFVTSQPFISPPEARALLAANQFTASAAFVPQNASFQNSTQMQQGPPRSAQELLFRPIQHQRTPRSMIQRALHTPQEFTNAFLTFVSDQVTQEKPAPSEQLFQPSAQQPIHTTRKSQQRPAAIAQPARPVLQQPVMQDVQQITNDVEELEQQLLNQDVLQEANNLPLQQAAKPIRRSLKDTKRNNDLSLPAESNTITSNMQPATQAIEFIEVALPNIPRQQDPLHARKAVSNDFPSQLQPTLSSGFNPNRTEDMTPLLSRSAATSRLMPSAGKSAIPTMPEIGQPTRLQRNQAQVAPELGLIKQDSSTSTLTIDSTPANQLPQLQPVQSIQRPAANSTATAAIPLQRPDALTDDFDVSLPNFAQPITAAPLAQLKPVQSIQRPAANSNARATVPLQRPDASTDDFDVSLPNFAQPITAAPLAQLKPVQSIQRPAANSNATATVPLQRPDASTDDFDVSLPNFAQPTIANPLTEPQEHSHSKHKQSQGLTKQINQAPRLQTSTAQLTPPPTIILETRPTAQQVFHDPRTDIQFLFPEPNEKRKRRELPDKRNENQEFLQQNLNPETDIYPIQLLQPTSDLTLQSNDAADAYEETILQEDIVDQPAFADVVILQQMQAPITGQDTAQLQNNTELMTDELLDPALNQDIVDRTNTEPRELQQLRQDQPTLQEQPTQANLRVTRNQPAQTNLERLQPTTTRTFAPRTTGRINTLSPQRLPSTRVHATNLHNRFDLSQPREENSTSFEQITPGTFSIEEPSQESLQNYTQSEKRNDRYDFYQMEQEPFYPINFIDDRQDQDWQDQDFQDQDFAEFDMPYEHEIKNINEQNLKKDTAAPTEIITNIDTDQNENQQDLRPTNTANQPFNRASEIDLQQQQPDIILQKDETLLPIQNSPTTTNPTSTTAASSFSTLSPIAMIASAVAVAGLIILALFLL